VMAQVLFIVAQTPIGELELPCNSLWLFVDGDAQPHSQIAEYIGTTHENGFARADVGGSDARLYL
jgi:hypothetical protein